VPTVANSKPRKTESQPFHRVRAPTEAETQRPKKMRAKTSGGPKACTAQSAIAGVAAIIKIAEPTPPSAEQETAAPIALPARPCWVMG
jgi:dissimilatory sulfite reductase (desulfoviridin) alpha/beta subunit